MMRKNRRPNGKLSKGGTEISKVGATQIKRGSVVARRLNAKQAPILITGGAGFIGTNVADFFLSQGEAVRVYDNFSRPGVENNLEWLCGKHGDLIQLEKADIRDTAKLRRAVRGVSKVFHFAAQVAVTTSLARPLHDFEVNARGTLNVLEALRELSQPPPLIFTSTNKVYGALDDVRLRSGERRYEPVHDGTRAHGFDEARPLDFHSPYGCSKGAAEQYVLDYARTFAVPAVVFRMSCIYGPHQFGTEDQGWVAHFLIRALEGTPITVYGDGRQVRDILFIDDLLQAFLSANEHISKVSGRAYNIGGGARHTISLLELVDLIADLQGVRPQVRFDDWRTADQQYYVSDIRRFSGATGWQPKVGVRDGLERLCAWLQHSRKAQIPLAFSPGILAGADGYSPEPSARSKISRPGEENVPVSAPEPRSKRMWKLSGTTEPSVTDKIIPFP